MGKKKKTNEEIYPSVYSAYDIALKSYDWAIQRTDSINGAIDRLLAWISSITIGSMAIIAGKETFPPINSIWFYLGAGSFILSILIGVFAKVRGSLSLLSPKEIHEKCLHLREWEFKSNIIYWAKDAYLKNKKYINTKGHLYDAMIILFLFEAIFYGIWLFN